jgi:hypothetical protein
LSKVKSGAFLTLRFIRSDSPLIEVFMKIRIIICLTTAALFACAPTVKNPEPVAPKSASAVANPATPATPCAPIAAKECPIHFDKVGFCAKLIAVDSPIPTRKSTSFKLRIWDVTHGTSDGPFANPGLIPYVSLYMHMAAGGHGSLEVTTAASSEVGIYDVTGAVFTMLGEWEIRLQLKKNDGTVVDETVQNITI